MRGVRLALIILGGLAIALLGWSWSGRTDDGGTAEDEPGGPRGTVTVLAAASLTEAFEELGHRLAEQHPDLDVVFSFGPSSGLVEQVLAGAPADILATADPTTMNVAVEAGVVSGDVTMFAGNTLAVVVPPGNPGHVSGLTDLSRDELRIATCEPRVPCGAATERLLSAGGVRAAPDTLTTDVKEALSLVTLGEADAAVVYVTDAAAAGDSVETVVVEHADTVVNDYPVALVDRAPNREGARVVLDAIIGEPGQSILAEAGFLRP